MRVRRKEIRMAALFQVWKNRSDERETRDDPESADRHRNVSDCSIQRRADKVCLRSGKRKAGCLVFLFLAAACCAGLIALGREARTLDILDVLFTRNPAYRFLAKRGILLEDRETYDYAKEFLRLAQKRDTTAMKKLFAPNAIAEIGEQELDGMLAVFVDYFQVDSFTLERDIGPSTAESRDHGKRSKELKGPLEISTDKGAFRMAIKCVSRDDWDENNVGVWSVYLIAREKDTDLTHPYIGDKEYRTGIYIDVGRPD